MFRIIERECGDWLVFSVLGEIDLAGAPTLRSKGRRAIGEGHSKLAVDMSSVDLLDSVGLGVLIGLRRRAREAGGQMVLAGPRDPVLRMLVACEVDHLFMTVATVGDLVALRDPQPRS